MDIKELEAQRKKCEAELAEIQEKLNMIHQKELHERRETAIRKIEFLREHRDVVLRLLEHDRESCDDEHPCNGYSYVKDAPSCRKCFLIELLNGKLFYEGDYDINFEIGINPIE